MLQTKKNILVLIESLNINNHSGAIVGSNTINSLVKGGHNVNILYPNLYGNEEPVWLENVNTSCFEIEEKPWSEKILSLFPKVRVLPAYVTGFNLERMRLIRSWKHAILDVLKNNNIDLILVLGVGNVFAAHFAMAHTTTDIPWIANIHDPYPNSHYPAPYKKPDSILQHKQYLQFNEVLKKATYVTFPSIRLMEWMTQFHTHIKNKAFVLPHPETTLTNLPDVSDDHKIFLSKDKFNLLHAGSLLGPRNPVYLIKAFARFIADDPERKEKSVLNIIGKIAKENTVFKKTYKNIENNLNILQARVSYKHSLQLLKQADVLILLEAIAKDSPFMPGKLADYITVDRPILALTPRTSETSRILGEGYPYITQTDNEDEIYKILVKLWERWKSEKNMTLNRLDLLEYISAKHINEILMENIK